MSLTLIKTWPYEKKDTTDLTKKNWNNPRMTGYLVIYIKISGLRDCYTLILLKIKQP